MSTHVRSSIYFGAKTRFIFGSLLLPNHLRSNKKQQPVFRITLEFFSGLLKKSLILCILKGEMPFKMHKIIIFSPKKLDKNICAFTT